MILDKLEYYKTHLSIVNCFLPVKMTKTEIEVLAAFMSLEGDVAKYRFGSTGRKIVMEQLKLKPSGLSNYIRELIAKEFLTEKVDIIEIWPILHPQPNFQEYRFRLDNKTYIQQHGTSNSQTNSPS